MTDRITDETWRPVVGYEGSYEVSDHGRVRSADRVIQLRDGRRRPHRGRTLTPWRDRKGYLYVDLGRGNKRYVHHLVLEAFIGPRPGGMETLHGPGSCAKPGCICKRYVEPGFTAAMLADIPSDEEF